MISGSIDYGKALLNELPTKVSWKEDELYVLYFGRINNWVESEKYGKDEETLMIQIVEAAIKNEFHIYVHFIPIASSRQEGDPILRVYPLGVMQNMVVSTFTEMLGLGVLEKVSD